jgi:MFS family permease
MTFAWAGPARNIEAEDKNNIEAEDKNKTQHSLIDAFKSGKVYALCAIYFTLMINLYGIAFWLPTIIKAFGVQGYLSVGLLSAIPWGFATIGMLIISRHSDQTGERRWRYVVNVCAGAAGIGIVNSVGNLGSYVGRNVTIWVQAISADPSAAMLCTSSR